MTECPRCGSGAHRRRLRTNRPSDGIYKFVDPERSDSSAQLSGRVVYCQCGYIDCGARRVLFYWCEQCKARYHCACVNELRTYYVAGSIVEALSTDQEPTAMVVEEDPPPVTTAYDECEDILPFDNSDDQTRVSSSEDSDEDLQSSSSEQSESVAEEYLLSDLPSVGIVCASENSESEGAHIYPIARGNYVFLVNSTPCPHPTDSRAVEYLESVLEPNVSVGVRISYDRAWECVYNNRKSTRGDRWFYGTLKLISLAFCPGNINTGKHVGFPRRPDIGLHRKNKTYVFTDPAAYANLFVCACCKSVCSMVCHQNLYPFACSTTARADLNVFRAKTDDVDASGCYYGLLCNVCAAVETASNGVYCNQGLEHVIQNSIADTCVGELYMRTPESDALVLFPGVQDDIRSLWRGDMKNGLDKNARLFHAELASLLICLWGDSVTPWSSRLEKLRCRLRGCTKGEIERP